MMAESGRHALNAQLDSDQILLEAKHCWLRPAEICEILQNYKKFQIAPEPPNRPPSGSLFLFDRKVLRHFRRDGHNWRKNKDGRTTKEAHERLKCGGVDVLHCYYSYGEDNENFQRRSYWMLERELSHIALVHYMEVKGNRANFNRVRDADGIPASQQNEDDVSNTKIDSSAASRFQPYDYQRASPDTDTTSFNSTQAQEREEAEPAYRHQASPGFQSIHELQMPAMQNMDVGSIPYHPVPISNNYQGQSSAIPAMSFGLIKQGEESKNPMDNGMTYILQRDIEFPSWKNLVESSSSYMSFNFELSLPSTQSSPMRLMPRQDNELLDQVEASDSMGLHDTYLTDQSRQPMENDLQVEALNTVGSSLNSEPDGNLNVGGVMREGLKSPDSLDRWISKELGDVTESTKQPGSGAYLETVGSEHGDDSDIFTQVPLDNYILGPSLSQDQLFSITDISPNWAYSRSKVKVLIMGKFLRSQEEVENYKFACMFGELEVSSQIVRDGVLCCYTPSHGAGRVPFYITCSNRLACSEVREFEFRASPVEDVDSGEIPLRMRFGKLLSLGSGTPPTSVLSVEAETSLLCSKISEFLKDNTEWEQMLSLCKQDQFSADKVTDQLLQKLFKEKLHNWLLQKIVEGGKGPNVLDEDGQGVLHFAAALGYDWVIPPTIAAGVSVHFRDANGWTALHWAAYCGRERTVCFLISLGAAPGALTNPTPKHPSRRTPADLAVSNGHKGIAGYLAESAFRSHLMQLGLEYSEQSDREKAVETVSERQSWLGVGDLPHGLSLKDFFSAAVRNATQAAARIHQVFRVQSFPRKLLKEYDYEFLKEMQDKKKGVWNEDEDGKMITYASKQHESGNLTMSSESSGKRRRGSRERWISNQKNDPKRKCSTPQEEETVTMLNHPNQFQSNTYDNPRDGPLQSSPSFQDAPLPQANLNPFEDGPSTQEKGVDFSSEEEIRIRSHEILENDDMQHLLRLFSVGGHVSVSAPEDGFSFQSCMPSPSPGFSYNEDRTRSGKAVVGWLKMKAAMRWGLFIRKKAAERRAQLVELEDD